MKPIIWEGCYDWHWKGAITNEAFAHPAKFSRGLITRIYDHCLGRGYLKEGDVVGDCFGGIGTGGIMAAYAGLRWFGLELEPRFVDMAHANFELHESSWKTMGLPYPQIYQGDSRKFDTCLGQKVGAMIASPPYAGTSGQGGGGINVHGYVPKDAKNRNSNPDLVSERTYQGRGADRTDGNIEILKEGSVEGVISSPPYAAIAAGAGGLNTKPAKKPGQQSGRAPESASQSGNWSKDLLRYGKAEGQIARLPSGEVDAVVTSPPFRDARSDTTKSQPTQHGGECAERHHTTQAGAGYGQTDGQIDNLATGTVEGVVTSPPWEDNQSGGCPGSRLKAPPTAGKGHSASLAARERKAQRDEGRVYGESDGQIGNQTGETYWQAMAAVYGACFRAIKPGGVIVLVCKDYVKAKQRVPLCDDTVRLLEHLGFVMVERIHAMLVQETVHDDLFCGTTTTVKQRKSFFRRLAEKKGSPRIDYECVIFARKPMLT